MSIRRDWPKQTSSAKGGNSLNPVRSRKEGKPRLPFFAEREGFKPPERTSRSPDFESGPIGHSGISPVAAFSVAAAKVSIIYDLRFTIYDLFSLLPFFFSCFLPADITLQLSCTCFAVPLQRQTRQIHCKL